MPWAAFATVTVTRLGLPRTVVVCVAAITVGSGTRRLARTTPTASGCNDCANDRMTKSARDSFLLDEDSCTRELSEPGSNNGVGCGVWKESSG